MADVDFHLRMQNGYTFTCDASRYDDRNVPYSSIEISTKRWVNVGRADGSVQPEYDSQDVVWYLNNEQRAAFILMLTKLLAELNK